MKKLLRTPAQAAAGADERTPDAGGIGEAKVLPGVPPRK